MSETIAIIDPDGTQTTMHDWPSTSTSAVRPGVEGLFSPPFEVFGDEVPLEAGERVSHVRAERRVLLLPFRVYGSSETDLRSKVREWVTRFNPLRGDSTIRWTGPGGTSRDLTVRLTGGTEGEIDANTAGEWWQTLVLRFRGSDPWWYDTSTTTRTFTTGDAQTFFPIFPLTLSSSEVFGSASMTNDGDTHAWPVITITGPGTDPIVRNVTTGELLDLTGVTLTAGETVTIDTNPGVKTVVKNDGTNLFSSLTSSSSLWRLERGANTVQAEMGGTDGDSEVQLAFHRRWLSV